MSTAFLDHLHSKHVQAMDSIKRLTDVDAQDFPEHREAATLCKFISEHENRYCLLQHPENHGSFHECAQDFDTLCHVIYHAIVDDGDIAYVQLNEHSLGVESKSELGVVFKSKWEVTINDLLTADEQQFHVSLNELRQRHGVETVKHSISFLDDAYKFIEAVKKNDIEQQARSERVQQMLRDVTAKRTQESL